MSSKALQERIKMQEEAKEAARNAGYIASLIITVGGGKGKIMLDLVRELIEKHNIKKILYLCDNRRLRDSDTEGFPEQIKQWGKDLKPYIQLECYQTAYKWKDQYYDLVLGDEVDFAITPEYTKVFFNNKFRFKILVSGTLTATKKKVLKEIAPIVYRCSQVEAEKRGIINKTQYYVYNFKLTEDESYEYRKWTRALAKAALSNATQENINYLAGKRKEVLYNAGSSVKHVKRVKQWLYKNVEDSRIVIFCERKEQADRVSEYSYHGGNEKDDNLKKFQNGEISEFASVSKITRGINLKRANCSIFEGMTSSATRFDQRNGRMKRLSVDDMAVVIFMCPWYANQEGTEYKPTIVDQWINKATVNANIQLTNLTIKL